MQLLPEIENTSTQAAGREIGIFIFYVWQRSPFIFVSLLISACNPLSERWSPLYYWLRAPGEMERHPGLTRGDYR